MKRAALFLATAPICVALILFGPRLAAHALLFAGFASPAAALFDDPAWKGAALYAAGRWKEAAAAFAREPTNAYNLGIALAQDGRFEEAIAAFDRALAANANDEDAAFNKALLEAALRPAPMPEGGGVSGVVANSPATKAGGSRDRAPSEGETGGAGAGLAAGQETEGDGGPSGGAAKDGKGDSDAARFNRIVAGGAASGSNGAGSSGADSQNVAALLSERNNRMRRRLTEGGVHPSLEWLQALPDDPGRFLKLKIRGEKLRRLRAGGGQTVEDD